jgi:hypothetical protein
VSSITYRPLRGLTAGHTTSILAMVSHDVCEASSNTMSIGLPACICIQCICNYACILAILGHDVCDASSQIMPTGFLACVRMCVCVWVVGVFVCACESVDGWMDGCTYCVCMHVCMYVCVEDIYIYIYIYIYISQYTDILN